MRGINTQYKGYTIQIYVARVVRSSGNPVERYRIIDPDGNEIIDDIKLKREAVSMIDEMVNAGV